MKAVMTPPLDTHVAAFVDRLGDFRASLDMRERRMFDRMLLAAASGAEADVQGYMFSATSAKHLALVAVMALGIVAGTLAPAMSGTALAAPLEQPTLNEPMGTRGGTRPPSPGTGSGTTTPSGGSTITTNVPGVGTIQVNLGSGPATGPTTPVPPNWGPGYTGPLGGPMVPGTQPQPGIAELTRQVRELQEQIAQQSLPPYTRGTLTTAPPAQYTLPRANATREAIGLPTVDPLDPTGEIQRLRNEQQALLQQIQELQRQVQQTQQATAPAAAPAPAPALPTIPPTSYAVAPRTDPNYGQSLAAAEAQYNNAIANLQAQINAYQGPQENLVDANRALRDLQTNLANLKRTAEDTARNANVQSGEPTPARPPDADIQQTVREAQRANEAVQNPGQAIGDATAHAVSGSEPARAGSPGGTTLIQSGAAANQELQAQEAAERGPSSAPSTPPSTAPATGRNWTH
jgi:hypothetical protein